MIKTDVLKEKNEFMEISFNKDKKDDEIIKVLIKAEKEGFEKGYSEYREKIQKIIEDFARIKDEFEKEKEMIRKEYENRMIEIAFNIAEKILRYEIDKNSYIKFIDSQIKNNENSGSKLLISMSDYEKLKEWIDSNETVKKSVEVSAELKEGEIYIKKGDYIRDITVLNQFEILKENFLGS